LKKDNINELIQQVKKDFVKTRKKILSKNPIEDRRHKCGVPLTNYIKYNNNGDTKKKINSFILDVENKSFLLGMKHNTHYTSILPHLINSNFCSVAALIKHPIPRYYRRKRLIFQ
jgi:hypothetical protein